MLGEHAIPMTAPERDAVDALLAGYDGVASLTRNDPGETGPVRVEAGASTWLVHDDGTTEEL